MITRKSRWIWALAVALSATAWSAHDACANAISYGTIGWIDTPAGATPGLINFSGTTGTITEAGSANLGQFQVMPAALTGPKVDYSGDPFHVIVYGGPNQSQLITGILKGSVGAGTSNMLTATIDSVMPFGTGTLPFNLNVPIGVAMTLSTTPGSSTTIFSAAASPIPEPTSVAVFAMALGGLVFWRRRPGR